MKRITDPSFKYVPSHATDIRKTFRRVRKEQCGGTQRAHTPHPDRFYEEDCNERS